jgi:hypothetical protein
MNSKITWPDGPLSVKPFAECSCACDTYTQEGTLREGGMHQRPKEHGEGTASKTEFYLNAGALKSHSLLEREQTLMPVGSWTCLRRQSRCSSVGRGSCRPPIPKREPETSSSRMPWCRCGYQRKIRVLKIVQMQKKQTCMLPCIPQALDRPLSPYSE